MMIWGQLFHSSGSEVETAFLPKLSSHKAALATPPLNSLRKSTGKVAKLDGSISTIGVDIGILTNGRFCFLDETLMWIPDVCNFL
jgi:hypothetical protein